jgi:hypothetical protein
MDLRKAYFDMFIDDGTQWVLWIKQSDNEEAVYFNNYFPGNITRFADSLDDILMQSGLNQAKWANVPDADERAYQQELWSSIKRY